ncbi:MAG: oxidoreductase [Alphaproteobacteria bacterium]|nr:MAG: oxidoreductase [Alphaproteobacteria bacterium]
MPVTLTVAAIRDVTERVREFLLEPAGEAPARHAAGAHLDFDLPVGRRSYSLIDWPDDAPGTLRIAVQREDEGAGGSRAMHALTPGARLSAEGPRNDFPLRDHDGPALLLAGGIGITPIISHATALAAADRPFALHYAVRSRTAAAYADRLAEQFGERLHLWPDDETPIDLPALMAAQGRGTHLYVCGPKGLIEAARAAFTAAGHDDGAVHFELFASEAAQAGDQPFEVEIASTGQVFTIPPGRTIIEVLEEAGIDLVYDCQRGDCGICQTGVIAGTPDHRDVVLSESERAGGKVMQICVSRAKTPRLVLDL